MEDVTTALSDVRKGAHLGMPEQVGQLLDDEPFQVTGSAIGEDDLLGAAEAFQPIVKALADGIESLLPCNGIAAADATEEAKAVRVAGQHGGAGHVLVNGHLVTAVVQ